MAAIGQARPGNTTIRTPLFVLGVALALLAFLAMFAFGLIFSRGVGNAGQARLVVATQDIDPRQAVSDSMITMGWGPSSMAAIGFVTVADLKGYHSVVPIYKGEVITRNLVTSNPDDITGLVDAFLPIPKGYVAMTVPTSEQIGVAGYPAQGDYLDIIATLNKNLFGKQYDGFVTKVVYTHVYIIRVGPASTLPKQGQPQGVSSSVTVLLSLCDAQYLNWLLTVGTVKYTLISQKDYGTPVTAPDPTCPSTLDAPNAIGAALVDVRWGFTKA